MLEHGVVMSCRDACDSRHMLVCVCVCDVCAMLFAVGGRSPMYALFAETLDGAVTIRAFEQEVGTSASCSFCIVGTVVYKCCVVLAHAP